MMKSVRHPAAPAAVAVMFTTLLVVVSILSIFGSQHLLVLRAIFESDNSNWEHRDDVLRLMRHKKAGHRITLGIHLAQRLGPYP
jgi:hypothetical protein